MVLPTSSTRRILLDQKSEPTLFPGSGGPWLQMTSALQILYIFNEENDKSEELYFFSDMQKLSVSEFFLMVACVNSSLEPCSCRFSLIDVACHDSQPSVQIGALMALRTLSRQDELKKVS